MPKGADELGIRWNGPVLSGAMSVQARQEREKWAWLGPTDMVYARVEDYDPVARAQCGMGELARGWSEQDRGLGMGTLNSEPPK